jgi:RNA polymerase sigma factor (sigma-70 family)
MGEIDKDIVQEVLNGNVQAYGRLVDRHKARAMTLAMRILKNREDAEEALQDAFVRAYHALGSFEWKSSFSTWLYRIVYNTCATAAGKRNRIHPLSINEEDDHGIEAEIESDELPPDIKMESDEFSRIVHEEVENLPVAYGSTFTLFVLHEMSYEEIVQTTGLPLGTVKARLFRARVLLREAILKRTEQSIAVME